MFTYVALQFVEKSVHYLKQATVSKCMYCGLPFNVFQCTCSVLGVPRDATEDDIRKQYRKLAVLIHPDKVLFEADLTCWFPSKMLTIIEIIISCIPATETELQLPSLHCCTVCLQEFLDWKNDNLSLSQGIVYFVLVL